MEVSRRWQKENYAASQVFAAQDFSAPCEQRELESVSISANKNVYWNHYDPYV